MYIWATDQLWASGGLEENLPNNVDTNQMRCELKDLRYSLSWLILKTMWLLQMAPWAFVSLSKRKISVSYWLTGIGKYHRIYVLGYFRAYYSKWKKEFFKLDNRSRASRFIFNLHFHIMVNLTNKCIRSCHFQYRIEPIIEWCSQLSGLEFILKRQVEMVGE